MDWFCKFDSGLEFVWDFGDGTTFTGVYPPDHVYNSTGYPYTVTLKINGICCDTEFSKIIDKACNVTLSDNFYYDSDGNQYINIAAWKITPVNDDYDYHWDLGDGNTFDGHSNITDINGNILPGHFSHRYSVSVDDEFTVTLTITAKDGSCTQVITKTVFVGCGHTYGWEEKDIDFTAGGRSWSLEGNIWSKNNALFSSLGANSKAFRKWFGIWWRKRAEFLEVHIEGDVVDVNADIICTIIDLESEEKTATNTKRVEIDVDISTIEDHHFFDNHVISYHKITQDGVTKRIPQLFLID